MKIRSGVGWLMLCAALLVPVSAGAVATDLHINGQPEECTIVLKQGGKTQTVKTDTTGHVKVDLIPDQPVTVTTRNYDYASIPVTQTPPPQGGAFEIPVTPSAPLVQTPQGFGSFGLAPRYDGEFLHDMKITKDSESTNGKVTSVMSTNPPKVSFNYNAGSVDVPIGLPGIHLFGDSWLYAAPVFTVGAGVYDLKFTDRKTGDSTAFSGSGPMIGGGFGSTIMNARCPWFGGFDVLYRDNLGTGVSQSPSSNSKVSLDNTLSYYEWNVAARVGYSFSTGLQVVRSVAPWGGVEFDSTNVKLTGSGMANGQSFGFKNEVNTNDFKGIVGADSHFWGPVFGRAQVSFNDTDYAVMAKLVYQFDVCDWWR